MGLLFDLWMFLRPHTFKGTTLQCLASFLVASQYCGVPISMETIGLLWQCILSSWMVNTYAMGIN